MNAETIASLTTAAGTLVLAVATYSSTQAATRASRIAEQSLLAGLRPVLMHARLDDPKQKVGFMDQHWVHFQGAGAAIDVTEDAIYMAAAIRNVGTGIAVLQGWTVRERATGQQERPEVEAFTMLTRDIYIPAGDLGFWQGAIRDRHREEFALVSTAARDRQPIVIDILYSDLHGAQQTITRLSLSPAGTDMWIGSVGRHWPVPEAQTSRWRRRHANEES